MREVDADCVSHSYARELTSTTAVLQSITIFLAQRHRNSSHVLQSQSLDLNWQPCSHMPTHSPLTWLLPLSPGLVLYTVSGPGELLSALRGVLPGAVGQKKQFNSYLKEETTRGQRVDFTQIYSEIECMHGVCFSLTSFTLPVKQQPS